MDRRPRSTSPLSPVVTPRCSTSASFSRLSTLSPTSCLRRTLYCFSLIASPLQPFTPSPHENVPIRIDLNSTSSEPSLLRIRRAMTSGGGSRDRKRAAHMLLGFLSVIAEASGLGAWNGLTLRRSMTWSCTWRLIVAQTTNSESLWVPNLFFQKRSPIRKGQ